MDIETIKTLAATPPPLFAFRFHNVKECRVEIARLETLAGVRHAPFISNLAQANCRAELLAKLVEARTIAPAASTAATAPAPTAEPSGSGEIPLAKLRGLCASVLGTAPPASRAECHQAIHFAGLNIAGIPPAKHVVSRTGLDRAIWARRQKAVDAFLKANQ